MTSQHINPADYCSWLGPALAVAIGIALVGVWHLPAWVFMWVLAFAIFAGFKWLTYCEERVGGLAVETHAVPLPVLLAGDVVERVPQNDPHHTASELHSGLDRSCAKNADWRWLGPVRGPKDPRRCTSGAWLGGLRSENFESLRIVNTGQKKNIETGQKPKVKLHPHCHQRAEGLYEDGHSTGTAATLELLGSCGYDVELFDTGCCGMAGTFGYEAEHFELSMKVGELKLFPAVGEMGKEHADPLDGIQQTSLENPKSKILSSAAACRLRSARGPALRPSTRTCWWRVS